MTDSSIRVRLAAMLAVAATFSLTSVAFAGDASPAAQVRVAASTSLEPLALAAAKKYGLQYTGISVAVTAAPSSGALAALAGGTADVALTDTAPADTSLRDHKIAVLPFAFVTNHKDGVSSLTATQIRDLLTGKISNWNEIGGADVPVQVVGRGPHSGITHLLERRYLGGKSLTAATSIADATDTAITTVEKTAGAVSIVTFAAARATNGAIDTLALDGAAPDEAHVGDGSYPLWSYEYAITAGAPSTSVSRFLSVVASDRPMLASLGFISVSDLGPGALKLSNDLPAFGSRPLPL